MNRTVLAVLALLAAGTANIVSAQVVATEEFRTIRTYPFGRPDPVPMLARDARMYPYHAFDGYSVDGRPAEWRTVRLENEHIAVWVLPDVGGKVWGAVEKAGGEEFIYRNEVMKFRNIALRGPWTSGGIEFNFGVIGHAPWTATPVDYVVEKHSDGSASVVVGAMDIPSRTFWRVRIRLGNGESAFTTETLWYNPTPLAQPYYNWMTGATFARQDLELQVPGTRYLGHGGHASPWPVDDKGRNLANYRENTFESHKSYHVVGEFQDFFGGYFHDGQWGFGHWAPYSDHPGQKMWLWSLAGDGEIWDPLLTDTDGQYVEFQAGRLFVQYSQGDPTNPIREASFDPYRTDRWAERWFPIRTIGGMDEASASGVLHVETDGDVAKVGLNAFRAGEATVVVRSGGRVVARRPVTVRPLAAVVERVAGIDPADLEIAVPELGLSWSSRPDSTRLDRPFATDAYPVHTRTEPDRLAMTAAELVDARRLPEARATVERALRLDPWNPTGLRVATDLALRSGRAADAVGSARRLLQLDAYDPGANWLAGLAYRAAGHRTDAREAFGWAERATAYRHAAHVQLAELALGDGAYDEAARHADRALAYDVDGIAAWMVKAVALRRAGRAEEAAAARARLLELDPLHHGARMETWLATGATRDRDAARAAIRSELAEQTWLELAAGYLGQGLADDAARVLAIAPDPAEVLVWRAWLARDTDPAASARLLSDAIARGPGFVFPFRPESLEIFEWADGASDAWPVTWWRALLLWGLDRPEEAATLFAELGDAPDYGPFHASRAALGATLAGREAVRSFPPAADDLYRAVSLTPDVPQLRHRLVDELGRLDRWEDARSEAERSVEAMPAEFSLVLKWARTLLETDHHDQAASLLDTVRVLPSEGGGNGRQLYEWAHLARALDRVGAGDREDALREIGRSLEWPPSLGQGRPYDPDERFQIALRGLLHADAGRADDAARDARALVEWRAGHPAAPAAVDALVHRTLRAAGLDEEAGALRTELSRRLADPSAAWALARIDGSRQASDAVLAAYPRLRTDYGFRLVARALDRTAPSGR